MITEMAFRVGQRIVLPSQVSGGHLQAAKSPGLWRGARKTVQRQKA